MWKISENAHYTPREETARRLAEALKRQLGTGLCGLLQTPGVVELLLNANGRVWVDRLGSGMELVGDMAASAAESFIGTVASTLKATCRRSQSSGLMLANSVDSCSD